MKTEKSLGQELIDAIDDALNTPGTGRLVKNIFDVKALRAELKLSQREFSEKYHINLETLRNWEQGKRLPDLTSIAFLTCIAKDPEMISKLLNEPPLDKSDIKKSHVFKKETTSKTVKKLVSSKKLKSAKVKNVA